MVKNIANLFADLEKYKKVVISVFFLLYLLLGLFLHKDYGFSYDEGVNRGNGAITANYINQILGDPVVLQDSVPDFRTYKDRDYGVLFELVLIGFEFIFNIKDSQNIYQTRHLLTFVMFWIGVIFFYFLLTGVFKDWKISLMGCFFMIVSPRIFAHSFYNSKDIVLLSFCIISTFTLVRFLDKKTLLYAFIHALACAAAVNIRIVGIYIPFVSGLFFGIELIKSDNRKKYIKAVLPGVSLFITLFLIFTYIFWPYLWENPVGNFIQAFKNMSKFRWDSEVFYWGTFISAYNLPWHYIPSWIIITTPVLFTVLFIAGLISIVYEFMKDPKHIYKNEYDRNGLLFLTLFFMPLGTVIILNSVLYDGWRQMFFIYPPFLCAALYGYIWILDIIKKQPFKKGYKTVAGICLILFLIGVIVPVHFMIKSHPNQNVYFNFLAGKSVSEKFDLDYWGLSYKEAFEFILNADSAGVVPVKISSTVMNGFFKILKKEDRERIENVPVEEASYYVSNYRTAKEFYAYQKRKYPYINEVFSVTVNDNKIVGVYKIK